MIDRVTNGLNGMPAYPQLDEQQIADVAAYVARVDAEVVAGSPPRWAAIRQAGCL